MKLNGRQSAPAACEFAFRGAQTLPMSLTLFPPPPLRRSLPSNLLPLLRRQSPRAGGAALQAAAPGELLRRSRRLRILLGPLSARQIDNEPGKLVRVAGTLGVLRQAPNVSLTSRACERSRLG